MEQESEEDEGYVIVALDRENGDVHPTRKNARVCGHGVTTAAGTVTTRVFAAS